MALHFKLIKLCRPLFITSRCYCEKSIYQKHEEGEKPRTVYGKPYPEWRKPWINREGEWSSKLNIFVEKNPNPDIMYTFSQIPNITVQKIRDWWSSMKILQEVENQKYLPERVTTLGVNLAAGHFFVYRHSAIRFKDSAEWIKSDTLNKLPDHYTDSLYIEAIDCANFHHNGIRYEGLENLRGLNFLKWLSLRNNKYVDVWCLDRIAGFNGRTLEYLDLRGCQLCMGGIFALARMSALKMLVITDPGPDNLALQAGLSMLEEDNPKLVINAEDPEEQVMLQ